MYKWIAVSPNDTTTGLFDSSGELIDALLDDGENLSHWKILEVTAEYKAKPIAPKYQLKKETWK